ncbi:uncharacterized protein LOC124639300 [Helicoverpa zea]|uniref:uncharacterized protein LOC124639300 n=1 Tax=Helicoverpa zea TaxID=7113 RepID=UPI001F5761E1|nr:uncharacterized protein LOC124639300 [Helicoverpa zea]
MENLQSFFDQMKIEMSKQTDDIMTRIDEKLIPFRLEMQELRSENEKLKEKLYNLERHKRINNLIVYGMKETEKSTVNLIEIIKRKFKEDLNITFEDRDVNTIYRIGKNNQENGKERPILLSFVNLWKKNEIMANKKKLKNIYVSEDYPKEIIDIRRKLQPKLEEERKKGNYAFINYDKLVIKQGKPGNEKRKREPSTSPNAKEQHPSKQQSSVKTHRLNAFDVMRNRSNSLPPTNLPTVQNA